MPAFASPTPDATPVWLVDAENWPTVKSAIGANAAAFAEHCGFQPNAGRMQLLPGEAGALAGVLFGVEEANASTRDAFGPGKLATSLPEGVYRFANSAQDLDLAALGFLLALYRYDRFKADQAAPTPRLVAPDGIDAIKIQRIAEAIAYGRDLVNAPPMCWVPNALEQEAVKLAEHFDASVTMVRGDELIGANFPLIHAVGRAGAKSRGSSTFRGDAKTRRRCRLSAKASPSTPAVSTSSRPRGWNLMKKDMGGAATALALARMIMEAGLDLRLRTLIPIVENAISAPAMRPGDVIVSRKGISVEIGNTDAEGRLILADALALADDDAPELMFDFATLTGAARVALGPDLPPFYTDDDALAGSIASHRGARARSAVADAALAPLRRDDRRLGRRHQQFGPGAGMAGSITAALFLRRFVEKAKAWAHFDVYAWNPKPRAHAPAGGEIQAARGLFELLSERYPKR